MFVKSFWQRFNPWSAPGESVSLNPVEQLTMRFLLNLGQGTRESIQTEVDSTRVAGPGEVDEALVRLMDQGLVQTSPDSDRGQEEALYYPSKKGAKLKGHIPIEPRTVTEFYL